MMFKKYWILLLAGLFLAACGGAPEDNSAVKAEADDAGISDAAEEDSEEGVFDPMVGTIDKAKSVEDMNMERKDEMDAAIEENQ